jgi:hypothetical protein
VDGKGVYRSLKTDDRGNLQTSAAQSEDAITTPEILSDIRIFLCAIMLGIQENLNEGNLAMGQYDLLAMARNFLQGDE